MKSQHHRAQHKMLDHDLGQRVHHRTPWYGVKVTYFPLPHNLWDDYNVTTELDYIDINVTIQYM